MTGGVTVGGGASILADAGASIGLGSPAQVTVLGSIIAPGGSITLSADSGASAYGFAQPGQAPVSHTSPGKSVWLGADAVLDVAGVALTDPFSTPERGLLALPTTGKVLNGGSVALSDDSGTVIVQAGAVIDVSGTSAIFDEAEAGSGRLGSVEEAPQQVWSNAGSITLAAFGGLYFDGTLEAQAGPPQAEGGTLTILPEVNTNTSVTINGTSVSFPGGSVTTVQPNGTKVITPGPTAVVFEQSGSFVPAGLMPGQDFPVTATQSTGSTLLFAADRLQGSGIDTLVVGGGTNASGTEQPLVAVAFAGNVNLSLRNAVVLNTTELLALDATELGGILAGTPLSSELATQTQNKTQDIGAPVVSISAPYVAIAGPVGSARPPIIRNRSPRHRSPMRRST